jgi:hypothetical protein
VFEALFEGEHAALPMRGGCNPGAERKSWGIDTFFNLFIVLSDRSWKKILGD